MTTKIFEEMDKKISLVQAILLTLGTATLVGTVAVGVAKQRMEEQETALKKEATNREEKLRIERAELQTRVKTLEAELSRVQAEKTIWSVIIDRCMALVSRVRGKGRQREFKNEE